MVGCGCECLLLNKKYMLGGSVYVYAAVVAYMNILICRESLKAEILRLCASGALWLWYLYMYSDRTMRLCSNMWSQ